MNRLLLVKPSIEHIDEIRAYRSECLAQDGGSHGDSGLEKCEDISSWINRCRLLECKDTLPDPNYVEADQYMLMQDGRKCILGMINFRHYLNDYLAEHAGHIGFGVRPSERRKGYARAMLQLCLEKCREVGLDRVLITCDADNEGSRRTIQACGGRFERLTQKENESDTDTERYWINLDPLEHYYSNRNENERLEHRHGIVEFLTTMRYIERYLVPDAKIIEIGAGTGRYSRAIADMGYAVEAVELIPHNIRIFKELMKPEQKITITQGNAIDLHMFQDNSFDITLSLGPLYHLFTEEDKNKAISEALRITKPGGVVFCSIHHKRWRNIGRRISK